MPAKKPVKKSAKTNPDKGRYTTLGERKFYRKIAVPTAPKPVKAVVKKAAKTVKVKPAPQERPLKAKQATRTPIDISSTGTPSEGRKSRRLQVAGGNQLVLDERTFDRHAAGESWAKVADVLGYANGSIARRAAMRHVARTTVPLTTV